MREPQRCCNQHRSKLGGQTFPDKFTNPFGLWLKMVEGLEWRAAIPASPFVMNVERIHVF